MRRVYMDANATTPLLPEVVEAMRPYWIEHFGNASSIHLHGQEARKAVDRAREILAEFFNCHDAEVVFNSGGTEGDNTAIFGLLHPGDHFITTSIEHSAILEASRRMAHHGVDTTFVPPLPSGLIDPNDILRAIRPETRLISVMLANNETGVIQPVEQIGKIAADTGVFFHIDAVQGAGKIPIDVRKIGCHLLSISAHKMHGPKGMGAMFVRRGTPVESLLVGGSHERRRRAGTENVAGIVGLAKAAELAMHSLEDGTIDRLGGLRHKLETELLRISGTGVNGSARRQVHSPRRQHHQHLVRSTGRRSAGHRARPEGRCGFRRIGLPLRRHRAQPRADGDGPGQSPRPRQPALQPAEDRHRSRRRLRALPSCPKRSNGSGRCRQSKPERWDERQRLASWLLACDLRRHKR